MEVPYHRSVSGEAEVQAAARAIRSGHPHGGGPFSRRMARMLSRITHCRFVFPTTSCTSAMELAWMGLVESGRLRPGDEVAMPSFAFPSCATAVLRAGLRPKFVEVEPATGNLDPEDLARRITRKTRGVLVLHYAGLPCRMEEIQRAAPGRIFVEDAAHALGASYRGRPAGSLGLAGCFSFHGTKNITCGEGGGLTTNDAGMARHLEVCYEKGTNRMDFLRGRVSKYRWVGPGGSFVLSDILAAVVCEQVRRLRWILAQRRKNAMLLGRLLSDLEEEGKLFLPANGEIRGARSAWHIFFVRVPAAAREKFIRALAASGVEATTHFEPLHSSPMGRRLGYRPSDLPATRRFAAEIVRLPVWAGLTRRQIQRVAESVFRACRRVL